MSSPLSRIRLAVQPISAEVFAPYGRLLQPRAHPVQRDFTDAGLECDGRPTLNVIWQPPEGLRFTRLERHSALTQGFVHLQGGPAVICVAAATDPSPESIPDPHALRAFRVEPGMAWLFHRHTWHALDRYVPGPEACTFLIINSDPNPTQIVDYATGVSELHADLGNDSAPRRIDHAAGQGIEFEIDSTGL